MMVEKYFDINQPGYSIKAKLYCRDIHTMNKMVISLHGFGGHKDNKATARFAEHTIAKYKNTGILIFDLPGHGDDVRKKLLLEDCDTYITIVIDYIKERYKINDLYIYATSFGAYLTLKYIHDHGNPFKKIVLRAPAVRIYDSMLNRIMSAGDYDKLEKGKEVLVGFDRKVKIDLKFMNDLKENDIMKLDFIDYADDILIIQGTKDDIVTCNDVVIFSENNVIELELIENADHRFQDLNKMNLAIADSIQFMFNK